MTYDELLLTLPHASSACLGVALLAALGLTLHHRRRARVARYARDPGARIHEGPALVSGTVEDDDESASGPVLTVEFAPQGDALAPRVRSRPFDLRLPSGLRLRVEPEADAARVAVDQVYQRAITETRYTTVVLPGDTVVLGGDVRREIDRRATGHGYRDAAIGWVLRAPAGGALRLVSTSVMAVHAARARFHGKWALGLSSALAIGVGLCAAPRPALRTLGVAGYGLAVIAGFLLALAYRHAADTSRPWDDRPVRG